jgi:hypothetical protein
LALALAVLDGGPASASRDAGAGAADEEAPADDGRLKMSLSSSGDNSALS